LYCNGELYDFRKEVMSVQVSYKKQFTLYLMLILVALVAYEGVQRTYDFFTINDCEYPHRELFVNMDYFTKLDMCYSYNHIDHDTVSSPTVLIVPNQTSNFYNINSDGIRGPEISEKNDDEYRIIMLGGSTTFGDVTSSDDYTIAGTLQTLFYENNFDNVEVINGGIGGASSIRELYYLKNYLLKFQPDMIIMYDGWNDVNYKNKYFSDMTLEEFSSTTYEENTRFKDEKENTLKIGKFLNSIEYRTGLNMAKIFYNLIDIENKSTIDTSEIRNVEVKNDELAHISEYMTRNWKDVCKLGLEKDFETVLLLQPMLTTGDRTIHAGEKQILSSISEKQKQDLEHIRNFSIQTEDILPCKNFFDIRDTFDDHNETLIYFDHGHMFDGGNVIVAKKIFDNISPIIQKNLNKLQ
jgi:hypothetical protein